MRALTWTLLAIMLGPSTSAQTRSRSAVAGTVSVSQIDLQGHRGARGLLPENTVPSMLAALDHGVVTLELDVVVTQDRRVVLSHEPWMSSVICRTPAGAAVREEEERSFNLYRLDYEAITAFDCGSRGHAGFPRQRPTAAAKPLLADVIRIADGYAGVTNRSLPQYNVEIKSDAEADGVFHPPPDSFAQLVYDILREEGVVNRSVIQSFDPRAIRAVRAIDASLSIALLVGNTDGFIQNLQRLGLTPDIYSPNHQLVDSALIDAARERDVLVIPWTVNERRDMDRLLRMGVDGLITDYPDIGRAAVDEYLRSTRRD